MDRPTRGEVDVNGTDLANLTENQLIDFRRKNIGFVFQSYNLIPVLTAKENVEFVMLLQNIPIEQRNKRTKELMTAIGLEDRMENRPSELSGGQQQRVAVARALASKPSFIIADEPTANLDSASTANLLDIMARLKQRRRNNFRFFYTRSARN